MREETRKKLRDVLGAVYTHTDRIINIVEAFMLADRSETMQAVAVATATASALPELPSRWARVNAMGHAEYVGPVEPLPRNGIRVRHHYEEDGEVGERVVDVYALHSVEYWDEGRWQAERAEIERVAKQRAQFRSQGHPEYVERDEGDGEDFDEPGEDDIPSDAAAGAPAAEDVERLDRSKPPPGYQIDGERCIFTDETGKRHVVPIDGSSSERLRETALRAAWTHCQEHRDPLGLQTFESDPGAWWYFCAESEGRSSGEAFESQAAARAAAWARYWRCVDVVRRIEALDARAPRLGSQVSPSAPVWPRVLTWPDQWLERAERELTELEATLGGEESTHG